MSIAPFVTAIVIALISWQCFKTFNNYLKARNIGLPIIVTPVEPINAFWALATPILSPICNRLPYRLGDFLHHGNFGWHFRSQNYLLDRYGPAFVVVNPGGIHLNLSDGLAIEELLNRRKDFIKPNSFYRIIELFGKNVDTVNGEDWQRHRKITAPPFNERNSALVWKESISQSEGMLKSWMTAGEAGTVKTSDDTMTLALHVITGAGFGRFFPFHGGVTALTNGHTMSFKDSLSIVLHQFLAVLFTNAIPFSKFLPKRFSTIRIAVIEFKRYLLEFVKEERSAIHGDSEKDNLMSAMLRASDRRESKGAGKDTLTDDEIFGNLFVFTFAGHESTANTLAYAITLLAADLDLQYWVKDEVQSVLKDMNDHGTWDYEKVFPQLKRCLAVMFETLRLFGPVVSFPRATNNLHQTLSIKGKSYVIPPDTLIYGNLSAVHASDYWLNDDPYVWRPKRWILNNENKGFLGKEDLLQPPSHAFMAWSSGPRLCPGKKFAQVEFVATMARLLHRHNVKPALEVGETSLQASQRLHKAVVNSELLLTLKMAHPESVSLIWADDS
ncbi:cytochrome P450 [Tricladium varicosporioides]|nr:cytochrome P450 [Hymenoscyphus varicosporioides]